MRQTLLLLSLLVQMFFAPQPAWTQSNYPIYVSPTLLPPYSLKLSDYSAYGSQRMMVTIVVNDLEVANLPVKLRVKMETAGVTIENPITINTTPIFLDGGSATILFGEDLVDYFNINNLQFKGYSKEAYRRSGQLPEGFYRFSVEVLHFHTNRVISNTGSVTAWIALGKPPVLRTPSNDVELGQYMGVPLTFSWLASNVGSPVSAGSIRYKFEMWEVRVKGVNPYTIVSSIPVFHDFVTSSTSYSFNPAGVMMEEGLTYAWRVTAFDESGLVPFEQNGQSEVRTFRYKSRCEEVQTVTAAASGQKGSFIWTPDRNHSSYNVEVRNTASDWFLANETFDSKVEFYELERGQTYEIRVQAVCNGNASSVSDYTAWTALTLPEAQPKDNTDECPDCGCSDDLPDVRLTNFELRQDLAPGDTLSNKTGTTRFVVHSVEPQGDGIYKGVFYFWAEIWGVKIPCDFWDLQVNTDNVIVNMDYQSINDPMFLVDVDALIATGSELLDQVAVVTTNTAIVDTIPVLEDFDYLVVQDGQLVAIVLNEDGEPVETALNITAEQAKNALITNGHGDEVVITSKGEVMGVKEYQATGGNSRLMQNYKEEKERNELSEGTMVNFAPHAAQKYGFDRYNEEKTALQHLYPTLHNGYRPAFKSVESFRYDKVGVDLTAGLSFRDEMGVPAIAMDGGVSVQGTQSGSNRAFYAYRALTDSTEELVGKLNVLSFDNAPKRVHIIPVNGAIIPSQIDLQTTLNRVYSQAIATWTVVPEAGVNVEFPGGRMTHDGSGGLSTYNKDQEAIVNAYVSSGRQIERDDLYLFYVKDATFKDRSLAGYMPLQRQVGFIYGEPSLAIVAHELGHGAFNLRHTFSPKAYLAPEGKTQNLMDYAGGTDLWQNQWSLIQNPERVLFAWGQDESEGAMMRRDREFYIRIGENEINYFDGDTIFIIGLPELQISLFNKDDKKISGKTWTYNKELIEEDSNSVSIKPQSYNEIEVLEVEFSRNIIQTSTIKINFKFSTDRIRFARYGLYSSSDTLQLYSEPEVSFRLDNGTIEDIPESNDIISWEWNNQVYETEITEFTTIKIGEDNKMYSLKINYKNSSSEYYIKSLQAPIINIKRSSMNSRSVDSYGFDNYSYEKEDIHNRYKDEYYISSINQKPYKTPWLTSKTGITFFYLDIEVPFKAENTIRYLVNWDDNQYGKADFSIQKGRNVASMDFDFIEPTGLFQKVEIIDMRGQIKGQIMIATNTDALVKKTLIPVVVKTARGLTSVPSTFKSQLNERSFNQAFFEWDIPLNSKILDIDAVASKYTISQEDSRILNSTILNNDSDIAYYRSWLVREYEAVQGIPDGNTPVVFFTDMIMRGDHGKNITGQYGVYGEESNTRVYIFYYKNASPCTWTHELGHSLGLGHTFEPEIVGSTSEGKTANFMDYVRERYQFWKWQWFLINDKLNIE